MTKEVCNGIGDVRTDDESSGGRSGLAYRAHSIGLADKRRLIPASMNASARDQRGGEWSHRDGRLCPNHATRFREACSL